MLKKCTWVPGIHKDPQTSPRYFLQDTILQIPKICIVKLSHFEPITRKLVVVSVYSLLKVINNSLYYFLVSWGLSLILTYSHPLGVSQQALAFSSGPLALQVLLVLDLMA